MNRFDIARSIAARQDAFMRSIGMAESFGGAYTRKVYSDAEVDRIFGYPASHKSTWHVEMDYDKHYKSNL